MSEHPAQEIAYPGTESQMAQQPRDEMRDYAGGGLLEGKVALVTGGDSGIGRAVCVAFAKEGADVAISYLNEDDDARKTAALVQGLADAPNICEQDQWSGSSQAASRSSAGRCAGEQRGVSAPGREPEDLTLARFAHFERAEFRTPAGRAAMTAVLSAAAVYLILMVLFRLTGKRTLAQVTTFDLVLLLIISEATQQALIGEDFSITQAFIVIMTLVVLERSSDYLTWRFPWFRRWTESQPAVLVRHGVPEEKVLRHYRLTLDDVLTAGREQHGLRSFDQVDWAVLENSGGISVIPVGIALPRSG